MQRLALLAVVSGTTALLAAAAASAGTIRYQNVIGPKGTAQMSVKVFKSAAFSVRLRTSTHGRTRLFLEGATAPSGEPLIDTRTSGCEGAAGSFVCTGSYESLPRGTYTFRVEYRGDTPEKAGIELTVRW
jgi:hypothetical protein